jgi:hypothetical protein
MDQREAAAGLNLEGNDTMSGRRGGISIPTMDQREAAAVLNLAGNNTIAGREDSFYQFPQRSKTLDVDTTWDVHTATDDSLPSSPESFAAIICVNGTPHYASIQGRLGDEIT